MVQIAGLDVPTGLECLLLHKNFETDSNHEKRKKYVLRSILVLHINKVILSFRIYKNLYNWLRQKKLVFGQRVTYPEELVEWIRETYPDSNMGKYDQQEKNSRPLGKLKAFFDINWGECQCKN